MEKKKVKIIILFVVQVLLLAALFIYAENRRLEQYWFYGSEMTYTDVYKEDGQYRKIRSPQLPLKVGSYELEMLYESSGKDAEIVFRNHGEESFAIHCNNEMYLYEGAHELKADFRLSFDADEFSAILYCPEYDDFRIDHMVIRETNDKFYGLILFLFVVFVVMDVVFILDERINPDRIKHKKGVVCAIAIATFFASLPLMVHYLMYGHDLEFHLLRIDGIATALSNGTFPVRMHPNFMDGYGYPTGIYYPELFLYIPAILHLMGVPLMSAYKCFLLVENIATALIAWYGGKIIFKSDKYASLFCVLYTLLPYRMINEYYRAAVGESLAMMFLPLLIAALYLLLEKDAEKGKLNKASALLVIAVSGVLQSHILSCEMYALFGIITVAICANRFFKPQVLIAVGKSVIWVLLLNLWFLVPFMEAFSLDVNVRYETPVSIGPHGLNIWQLFAFTPDATGNSKAITTGIANEMPLYLGWATVICLFIGIMGIVKLYEQRKDDIKAMGVICLVTGCIAAWMTTYLFPWNVLAGIPKISQLFQTIQFPWRYLSVAGGLLIIAGLIVIMSWKNEEYRKKTAILLVGISLFITLSFCQSMAENKAYHMIYDTAGLNTYGVMGEEYLYYGTDVNELEENSVWASWYYREKGNIICGISETDSVDFVYNLPLLYYPWYEAADIQTGERMSVIKGENNVAVLEVPDGYSGTVVVTFTEPLLWKISTGVSFLTGIVFILYVVSLRRKKCLFCKEKKHSNTV